jgi:hypothetical protein
MPLSKQQAHALAGEWYVWFVARHEEDPGTPKYWNDLWDVLMSLLEEHAPELERPWKDLEWTREPEVRAGIRPVIADEAKTAQFLASRGVVLTSEAQALFLDCVLDEFIAAILLLEKRSRGDYSEDERPSQFPKFTARKTVRVTTGMTPWGRQRRWSLRRMLEQSPLRTLARASRTF